MTDSFGTYLKGFSARGRRELQNPLSPPRLILAAVQEAAKTDSTVTDKDLMDEVGLGEAEFRKALQLLADEQLVTVRPQKGNLVVEAVKDAKIPED